MRIGVEDQVNLRTRASEDTGQRKWEKMGPVLEKSRGHTRKDPIFGWFEDK